MVSAIAAPPQRFLAFVVNKSFVLIDFPEPDFLQHMLTPSVLPDRIGVHCFTLQFFKCVIQCQYLRRCAVAFVLYAVIAQMDPQCAALLIPINVLQDHFANGHEPTHHRQMHSVKIPLALPIGVTAAPIITIRPKF